MTWGGVTVVNAIAAGGGAAAAVDLPLEARVALQEGPVTVEADVPEADPAPVAGAVRRVLEAHDLPDRGARVATDSRIPVSAGLKSSSAATTAAALAADVAAADEGGVDRLGDEACLRAGVAASIEAGVSATGAWDDAYASLRGGLCVTDNDDETLLERYTLPPDHRVVLHVPPEATATAQAAARDHAPAERPARLAHELALEGRWADAMTVNGLAYAALYERDPAPHLRAVEAGAATASLSGTGPATAAVAPDDAAKDVAEALTPLPGDVQVVDHARTPAEVEPC